MPEFRVSIDGKIPREKEQAIAAAIQQAVIPHISDLGHDGQPVGVLIPHRDWWGLIARSLRPEIAQEAFGEKAADGRVAQT